MLNGRSCILSRLTHDTESGSLVQRWKDIALNTCVCRVYPELGEVKGQTRTLRSDLLKRYTAGYGRYVVWKH